ncbi:MAG: nucleotidyltransferase domain-containing protein [Clostridiales bacterium]|nr:nucleotidyltransferase domain-containing protein [Clostridiales bacterium]
MTALKELRIEKELTQQQAADLVGISLRSYKSYENDREKEGSFKYKYIIDRLAMLKPLDEEHGLVTVDYIRRKCLPILEKYEVDYCYLFGSYAKGRATEKSDIDLLLSTKIRGIRFFGLVEELREALHKKVDVLDVNQLEGNLALTKEVLKDGIKIYG